MEENYKKIIEENLNKYEEKMKEKEEQFKKELEEKQKKISYKYLIFINIFYNYIYNNEQFL